MLHLILHGLKVIVSNKPVALRMISDVLVTTFSIRPLMITNLSDAFG